MMSDYCAEGAQPLQILEVAGDVQLNLDNLSRIRQNLREQRADLVSIIGVMGSYRTGKSFLLDLLLRRMRTQSRQDMVPDEDARSKWKLDDSKKDMPLPSWVYDGDATHISEGKLGEVCTGFAYRGGKEKCTQGIWIWSQPFMFEKEGQRIAVLLMDTQGAWDSSLSKHQSATIFGLSAMLSSKLIFNIQNKIEEEQMQNLDYFTTYAQAAGAGLSCGENLFGHLEILIRDWCHYEEGWNFQQCRDEMKEHLDQHMDVETVPADAKDRVQRLRSTFRQVDCSGLVHPSVKVTKKNWEGAIKDINPDFFFLLDDFCSTFFSGDFPQPSSPLGSKLTVANFESSLIAFVDAFRNNQMAVGLRDAFVKVQIMTAREEMMRGFVDELSQELPEHQVYDPLCLERETNRIKGIYVQNFRSTLQPFRMNLEDETREVERFIEQIHQSLSARVRKNDEAVESGTLMLVASPVVGLTVFFIASHHIIVYVGVPVVTYRSLKWHADKSNMPMFSQEVLKATGKDGKVFITNRYRDMQAIVIALDRLTPRNMRDALENEAVRITAVQAA